MQLMTISFALQSRLFSGQDDVQRTTSRFVKRVVNADGFFHVQVHTGALAELVGEAEADVIPRAFVFIGRVKATRIVEGADILIAQEFMKHVGLDIEGIVFAHILA